MTHNRGLNSARLKDALYDLPKAVKQFQNQLLSLPPVEDDESEEKDSDDLQGPRIEKLIIPTNITDFYSRLEVLCD